MKVLFVCRHNRFRSKVAEAIFKKNNKNKKFKVRSRATFPDYIPVAENVQKVLEEKGVKRINKYPKKLRKEDVEWADLIVVVANEVDRSFKNKKTLNWKVSDTNQSDVEGIRKRTDIIERKVLQLLKAVKK